MTIHTPQYYLKRDAEYLHWTGLLFTDNEAGAWLGTADDLDAFRRHHAQARLPDVRALRAVDPVGCKLIEADAP